jgi:uncharacterized protein with GYD domain
MPALPAHSGLSRFSSRHNLARGAPLSFRRVRARVHPCRGPASGPTLPAHRLTKEDAMPLFIMSMSWTEKGIKTIREWPKRAGEARSYAKKIGVTIKDVYLTSGDHDLIAIIEAPDTDRMARFALGIGGHGNVRTRTALAWTEADLARMVTDLPSEP